MLFFEVRAKSSVEMGIEMEKQKAVMVQVQGLVSGYGRKKILRGADFYIKEGECVGIVGANGCGKSTLFSVLSGTKRPSFGTITYAGRNPLKERRLFYHMVGYVPQENPLIPELSVRDNLKLWYTGKGQLEAMLNSSFGQMLQLREMLPLRTDRLSGGMKKRVSIGCAMAANPPLMILDEPSAALDLTCKEEMKEYLQTWKMAGGTILITTHEESELGLCDRLYVMHDGKLAEIDRNLRGRALADKF